MAELSGRQASDDGEAARRDFTESFYDFAQMALKEIWDRDPKKRGRKVYGKDVADLLGVDNATVSRRKHGHIPREGSLNRLFDEIKSARIEDREIGGFRNDREYWFKRRDAVDPINSGRRGSSRVKSQEGKEVTGWTECGVVRISSGSLGNETSAAGGADTAGTCHGCGIRSDGGEGCPELTALTRPPEVESTPATLRIGADASPLIVGEAVPGQQARTNDLAFGPERNLVATGQSQEGLGGIANRGQGEPAKPSQLGIEGSVTLKPSNLSVPANGTGAGTGKPGWPRFRRRFLIIVPTAAIVATALAIIVVVADLSRTVPEFTDGQCKDVATGRAPVHSAPVGGEETGYIVGAGQAVSGPCRYFIDNTGDPGNGHWFMQVTYTSPNSRYGYGYIWVQQLAYGSSHSCDRDGYNGSSGYHAYAINSDACLLTNYPEP